MKKPSQMTFTPTGFEAYRKPTRRERFLAEMDRVVPWAELVALVKPAYAKGTGVDPLSWTHFNVGIEGGSRKRVNSKKT